MSATSPRTRAQNHREARAPFSFGISRVRYQAPSSPIPTRRTALTTTMSP